MNHVVTPIFLLLVASIAAPSYAQSISSTAAASSPQVVEITAIDYAFRAPDTIPSGWTTLRLRNEGAEPHFVLISRLPEGKTAEDYQTDLSAQFNAVWYALRDDGIAQEEALAMLMESLPSWFPEVVFVGGTGIIAAGMATETTVNLEPGGYVLECYMKTAEGEIHYMEGMIRPLTVTETNSVESPPGSDVRITLSNFEMDIEGEVKPGRQTFEVHVAENPEEGFGHNVHVARLEPGTEVADIIRWMNFFELDGLRDPAPATFIGGVQLMPAGRTAYFIADFEQGRYLFVSEYTAAYGVYREVTVAP
jgi:hypothetical protein